MIWIGKVRNGGSARQGNRARFVGEIRVFYGGEGTSNPSGHCG